MALPLMLLYLDGKYSFAIVTKTISYWEMRNVYNMYLLTLHPL